MKFFKNIPQAVVHRAIGGYSQVYERTACGLSDGSYYHTVNNDLVTCEECIAVQTQLRLGKD
jgi:hypothetical protein